MPEWVVSLLVGLLGALIGAAAIVFAKRAELRHLRQSKSHERDSDLLAEMRETAGWIKERLSGYLAFESYSVELRQRIHRIGELRALAAHHPSVNSYAMKFENTAGIMWAREMTFNSFDEEQQHRQMIREDYGVLVEAIAKKLR